MNLSKILGSLKKINIRDRKVQTIAAIVVLGVLVAVGWYRYMYQPLRKDLVRLEADKKDKDTRLSAILAMKPQLEKIKAEIVAKGILLDSLKSIFPDEKEVPKLIHEITRLAQAANVHAVKFSPMADVKQEYYMENRYQITMWAGYHEFASFLSRLANLRLIINLGDVKLATHPAVSQATESDAPPAYTVEAMFTLTTFSSRK